MKQINYYRIEYNEMTGDLHLEADRTKPENINGYLTIAKGIHRKTCKRFV
jgi:hypothetical protein